MIEVALAAAGARRLADYLAGMTELVENAGSKDPGFFDAAKRMLAGLVRRDDWLEDEFAKADTARHQQHLLFCDPCRRFCVVSFVWGPGQRTPIHDHTTWGLIGMLRGGEISEQFELKGGRLAAAGETHLEPGDVTMVSPETGDIHRVRNAFDDRVSVSIHVYGADIGSVERHAYTPEGTVSGFVSGYSNRRLPNLWGRTDG